MKILLVGYDVHLCAKDDPLAVFFSLSPDDVGHRLPCGALIHAICDVCWSVPLI